MTVHCPEFLNLQQNPGELCNPVFCEIILLPTEENAAMRFMLPS